MDRGLTDNIAWRKLHRGRVALIMLLVLLHIPVMGNGEAKAQEYAGSPFTSFHSMQTFEKESEGIRAIRIPVYISLRSWENRSLGLRLRLAVTIAATDLFELLDQQLEEVSVLSFVPGVEFVLPMGRNHMLRPFLDLGTGSDNVSQKLHFLGALGLRTELIFPSGKHIFGLEPGFQVSVNSGRKIRNNTIFNPFITLSARRILGFDLAGHPPDAGIYFEGGYDFSTFELTSISASTNDIRLNYEIGVGFGYSQGRPRIGPFRLPRVRVGYRFGDLEGFRIRFGGDWLTTVATQKRIEQLEEREGP